MSIPVYVMVLLAFRRPESVEAALKSWYWAAPPPRCS